MAASAAFDWVGWITAAATAVLAAAAIVALFGLLDGRRTRHAELVTDLSRRWDEQPATDARQRSGDYDTAALVALVERVYRPLSGLPDPDDVEELFRLGRWLNVLETIGVLNAERALSRRVIFRLWGGQISAAWDKWRPAIELMRRIERRPGIYRHWEQTAKQMRHLLARELAGTRSGRRPLKPVAVVRR